jgi:hypothetical protein
MFLDHYDRFVRGTDEFMRRRIVMVFHVRGTPAGAMLDSCWGMQGLLSLLNLTQAICRNAFLGRRATRGQELLKTSFGILEIITRQGFIAQANFFSHNPSHQDGNYTARQCSLYRASQAIIPQASLHA